MYTHAAAAVELYRQFDTHSFQCLGNFIKTRKAAEAFIFRATGWWSSSSINAIIFYPNKHLICDGLAPLLRSTSPVRLCSLGHDKRNFFFHHHFAMGIQLRHGYRSYDKKVLLLFCIFRPSIEALPRGNSQL
jgi:hypothetical protein